MPMTVLLENAPDDLIQSLQQRATRHDRSLDAELVAIVEAAAQTSPHDILAEVRRLGMPVTESSVDIIRAARDGR